MGNNMATQRFLSQQADGLDTLMALLDAVKDPKAITDAHELVRKEMALTDEEIGKAEDARKLISQADVLSKDLEDRKAQVVLDEHDYAAKAGEMEAETYRMKEKADGLFMREKTVSDAEAKLSADVKKMEDYRLAGLNEVAGLRTTLEKDRSDLNAMAADLEVKEKDIAKANADLSVRLEKVKLREKAADL